MGRFAGPGFGSTRSAGKSRKPGEGQGLRSKCKRRVAQLLSAHVREKTRFRERIIELGRIRKWQGILNRIVPRIRKIDYLWRIGKWEIPDIGRIVRKVRRELVIRSRPWEVRDWVRLGMTWNAPSDHRQ